MHLTTDWESGTTSTTLDGRKHLMRTLPLTKSSRPQRSISWLEMSSSPLKVDPLVSPSKCSVSLLVSAQYSWLHQEWEPTGRMLPSDGTSGSASVVPVSSVTKLVTMYPWMWWGTQPLITTTGSLTTMWSHATDGRVDRSSPRDQATTEPLIIYIMHTCTLFKSI